MTRFYLDAPVSQWSSAHTKANRPRSTVEPLPASVSTRHKLTNQLKNKARKAFSGSRSSTRSLPVAEPIWPTAAKESRFFRLPLHVRQKIYGYLVGQNELLHVLLRYRSAPSRWRIAYRRCNASGNVENCYLKDCREFHDLVKGSYFGRFDRVGGLFLSCRDM
jgi:hypothetical protein